MTDEKVGPGGDEQELKNSPAPQEEGTSTTDVATEGEAAGAEGSDEGAPDDDDEEA